MEKSSLTLKTVKKHGFEILLEERLKEMIFEAMGKTPLAYYFAYCKDLNGKIKSIKK